MSSDITVCIATIPPRKTMLRKAMFSVVAQTLQPDAIVVQFDHDHEGAVATKNKALAQVKTRWTAWLDDDDYLLPNHLEALAEHIWRADVIYSWPIIEGAADPTPGRFAQPFDAEALREYSYVHTTTLFRTDLARKCGGFQHPAKTAPDGLKRDDHGFYLAMLDVGAKFHHVAQKTWVWNILGQNTSGDPARW